MRFRQGITSPVALRIFGTTYQHLANVSEIKDSINMYEENPSENAAHRDREKIKYK